ncbi:hypothetical protein N0V90_005287 [Kalmusia sp. IMI 367209]|nr:hypothetical protein N0V90_005287 [Kalmusia sp. IMI 367209]
MLGEDGMIATVYAAKSSPPEKIDQDEELVAAAGVSRWHGSFDGIGADSEEGWEIKAVTSKSGWGKMGLVGRCIDALTSSLIALEKEKLEKDGEEEGKVNLWLHAVEEVNGAYWRRRGWKDVRYFDEPVGAWGNKIWGQVNEV